MSLLHLLLGLFVVGLVSAHDDAHCGLEIDPYDYQGIAVPEHVEREALKKLQARKISRQSRLTINPIFGGSLLEPAYDGMRNCINLAIDIWEELISDPITVQIYFESGAQTGNILASTSFNITYSWSWSFIRQALQAKATSQTAVPFSSLPVTFPPVQLPAGINLSTNQIRLTNAQSKAFSAPGINQNMVDGRILIGSSITWDYNPSDGIDASAYDLLGVLVHEIGHALGFSSMIDTLQSITATNVTVDIRLLDFYRFYYGLNPFDFNTSPRHLLIRETTPHELKDGLSRSLPLLFETGTAGTGQQASHWLKTGVSTLNNGQWIGILNPSYIRGDQAGFSTDDYRAFALAGWTMNEQARPNLFGISFNGTYVTLTGMIFFPGSNFKCRFAGSTTVPATLTYKFRQVVCQVPSSYKTSTLVELTNDGSTYSNAVSVTTCTPNCGGLSCGSDGCDGSCGTCPSSSSCVNGVCVPVCTPSCQGRNCGSDGCSGSCGTCPSSSSCVDGVCVGVCVPSCEGRNCGKDGCGGSCGKCAKPTPDCVKGVCTCVPSCEGRNCGKDGCGGSCGDCAKPTPKCVDGVCTCIPSCEGKNCGKDGCGGSCGECSNPTPKCVEGICSVKTRL